MREIHRPHLIRSCRHLQWLSLRRMFLEYLQTAYEQGQFRFFSILERLSDPQVFARGTRYVRLSQRAPAMLKILCSIPMFQDCSCHTDF